MTDTTAATAGAKRAWVDEDDIPDTEVPSFLKGSHSTPQWAVTDAVREETAYSTEGDDASELPAVLRAPAKRFRSEDLDMLLSRTDALLSSKHDQQRAAAPRILSTLPLPRDTAHTMHWHRSGQLAIVGGNHHIYTFHAAGSYVEQLSKVDISAKLETTALCASGEEVVVVGHESYTPSLLHLSTEKLVPLTFLDTRDTAVYRNGRRDSQKSDFFIRRVATSAFESRLVAVASGAQVRLGSLSTGCLASQITTDGPVTDVAFTGVHEITVAAGNRLMVYDVRKSARRLRTLEDDGALQVSCFATTSQHASRMTAVGSTSGIVSVFDAHANQADTQAHKASKGPLKTFKNLSTPIQSIAFGLNSAQEVVLAFSTKGQKAGFRLAKVPDFAVVPSFPAVSTRHEFIQSIAIAPTVPILSVCERQKVTNYAL